MNESINKWKREINQAELKLILEFCLIKENRQWEGLNIQEIELTRISWEEINYPSHDTIAKAVLLITKAANQSL